MRRFLIVTIMFWNLLFGSDAMAQDWADKSRYAHANQELLAAEPDPSRVVLMGNSITEFWEETHPDFFVKNHLVCRGISGQVSSQMLARFRQDVIALKPCLVVINCGTNDIAENNGPYDEDITMDNIMSMTELALAHGIDVVLSSVLPCDEFCWNPTVKNVTDKISHLNALIVDYASQQPRVHYIDYNSAMRDNNGALPRELSDDGVHPSPAGYDIMERLLIEALEQLRN